MTKSTRLLAILAALMALPCAAAEAAPECPPFPLQQADSQGAKKPVHALARRPLPEGPIESVSITLERSICLGTCPGYKVELRGDGTGTYHGEDYVTVVGDHPLLVSQDAIRCLLADFRLADFWSLRPEYVAKIYDPPGYKVTLSIGGRTKSVYDYVGNEVGMPAIVHDLEDAIDSAAGIRRWTEGDETTVAALEAEGFDFRGPQGGRLLAEAAIRGSDAMVLALIAHHAPLDVRAGRDFEASGTPVEVAAMQGRLAVLRALIDAGAFTAGGRDAVSAALGASVASERSEIVAEILKYRPDVNRVDKWGKNPLASLIARANPYGLRPALEQDLAIIRMLVAEGADPNIRDNNGQTGLHSVLHPDLARALIAIGANLEIRDNDGNTPLLTISNEDTALALLEAGADPLAKNKDGRDFFDRARDRTWTQALAVAEARAKR